MTNGAGTVIESYRYDAFGAPTIKNGLGVVIASSAIGNRFMFTGREYLAKFGIYEYRARAYHPGLGRFMSEDPKGFDAGDYNLYRYCGNDPLDRVDPMGLADTATRGGGLASPWLTPWQQAMAWASSWDLRELQSAVRAVWNAENPGQTDSGNARAGGGAGGGGERSGNSSSFTGRAARGLNDWLVGTCNAYARTINWAAGVGREESFYGPNTVEARQMMGSAFAREAVAEYKAAGSPAAGYNKNAGNGLFNPFAPSNLLNPTRQFVGKYNVSVGPIGNNRIGVVLQNYTSMHSGSYTLLPSYDRASFRYGGSVVQYYYWSEPAK